MSTVIAKNVQIGTSGTATDNFTIFQPATPDGTLRIGNGNTGITSSFVSMTSAGAVSLSGAFSVTGNTTLSGSLSVAGNNISAVNSLGFRNRIINGDMRIDQRNAGASGTAIGGYTVDRWAYVASTSSKLTWQQNAGSVTPPVGFTNYLGITSSSAYSVPSGEVYELEQRIEGLNVSDLAWGTASASAVTLSFWVRSSLTGTFGGAITNSAGNRSYPFAYTISSANTWEQKSVTIAGDTTGTWLTTNGVGLILRFSVGAGSSLSGTAGAWAGSNLYSATGAVSVVGTSGATFYITGVQLEAGSVASPFERRDYGRELMMCQRYFWSSFASTGATPSGWGANFLTTSGYQNAALTTGMINQAFYLSITMRSSPTGSVWDHLGAAGKTSSFNPNAANYGGESGSIGSTSPSSWTLVRNSGNNASQIGAYVQLNAEL